MSIHVALNLVRHYRYHRPLSLSAQPVRLRPAPHRHCPNRQPGRVGEFVAGVRYRAWQPAAPPEPAHPDFPLTLDLRRSA